MDSQAQLHKSAFRLPPSEIAAALICLLYLAFLLYNSPQHHFGTYATETDFYHLYAPDAVRLTAGQFPLNQFQGPGYAVLLSVVTRFTGDVFVSGKWIAIFSAVLCIWMAFILFKQLFDEWTGVGAALLSTVIIEFPEFSLQATTDVFFLLMCLVAFVIFTGNYFSLRIRIILAAFFTGIAYLTRYNGVVLLGCFVLALLFLNLFEKPVKQRLGLTALFVMAFIITVLPWLVANYRHNGSPLHNANYLNMATLFYPDLADGEVTQDGTRKVRLVFHSFGEVLAYDPLRAFTQYLKNLGEIFMHSWDSTLVTPLLGGLGIAGFILALIQRQSKAVLLLLLTITGYFLLMGLNHWEARYFFLIGFCYAGLAAYLIIWLSNWVRGKELFLMNRSMFKQALPVLLIIGVWAQSFASASASFNNFMASHPYEMPAAAEYLRSQKAAPKSLKILARKPHLPFMSNQQWVFFPQVKSVDELKIWLEKNPIDYVVIGKRELKSRKELESLGDPATAPDWLEVVWTHDDPKLVLYRPKQ